MHAHGTNRARAVALLVALLPLGAISCARAFFGGPIEAIAAEAMPFSWFFDQYGRTVNPAGAPKMEPHRVFFNEAGIRQYAHATAEAIRRCDGCSVFVFIHGGKVSYEDARVRADAIRNAVSGTKLFPVLISWDAPAFPSYFSHARRPRGANPVRVLKPVMPLVTFGADIATAVAQLPSTVIHEFAEGVRLVRGSKAHYNDLKQVYKRQEQLGTIESQKVPKSGMTVLSHAPDMRNEISLIDTSHYASSAGERVGRTVSCSLFCWGARPGFGGLIDGLGTGMYDQMQTRTWYLFSNELYGQAFRTPDTVTTQYPHHFGVGDFVLTTGLSGVLAPLNRNNYPVISTPSPNVAVIELRDRAAPALNGTYTNTGIQMFGRRFFINYDPQKKNCSEGNEITITTTKKGWLPEMDMRVTPSYRPLLPILQMVGDSSNTSLLQISDKVSGLKFVGVGFQKLGLLEYTQYTLIDVSSSYFIPDESVLPERISFDRSLFFMDHKLGNAWKNTFNLRVKGFTFTNNFVDDLMGLPSDGETYISAVGTAFGPFTIRNNYVCCAIGMPFIWGARDVDYTTNNPNSNDILLEHNSFYTSPKHYPTSPTYVGDAYHGVVKNCSELKGGVNAVFRWNTCENQFSGGGSQWYGFTFSARSNGSPGAGTCSLDGSRTVITCPIERAKPNTRKCNRS